MGVEDEANVAKRTRNILLRCVLWTSITLVLWFNVVHVRRLRGRSMLPTLASGAYVVVYQLGTTLHPPRRGDIVCVRSNEDTTRVYCKRVIAEPGEEIEFRQGVVYINGEPLDEPYAITSPMWDQARIKLDGRHVYVVGDNRGMSDMSSHYQGQAKLENIIGKVAFVIYRGSVPAQPQRREATR